jgi:hypothetical protein
VRGLDSKCVSDSIRGVNQFMPHIVAMSLNLSGLITEIAVAILTLHS